MAKNSQKQVMQQMLRQAMMQLLKTAQIVQSLKQAMHLRTNPQILLRMQITATRTV